MAQEQCVIYRARVSKLKSDAYFENINGQTAPSYQKIEETYIFFYSLNDSKKSCSFWRLMGRGSHANQF